MPAVIPYLLTLGRRGVLAALLPLGAASAVSASDADPALALGTERYADDCAVCHGADARGNGPMTPALRIAPSNLRRLSAGNGGTFPEPYVRRVIDGRDLSSAAHGTVEMPAWGHAYKRALAGRGEQQVQRRIDALVAWLRSVQDD